MDRLGVGWFCNLYSPLLRSTFLQTPVESAEEAAFELAVQRLRVVIVDELHCLTGLQGFKS